MTLTLDRHLGDKRMGKISGRHGQIFTAFAVAVFVTIVMGGCSSMPHQQPHVDKTKSQITATGAFVDRYKTPAAISAWLLYGYYREGWRDKKYAQRFPGKPYTDTFAEHYDSLSAVASLWRQSQAKTPQHNADLDPLSSLQSASLLDDFVWICLRNPLWMDGPPKLDLPALKTWLAKRPAPFRLEIPAIVIDKPEHREIYLQPVPPQAPCDLNVDAALPVTVPDAAAKLDAGSRLLDAGTVGQPAQLIEEVLEAYKSKLRSGTRYRSFASVAELRTYTRAHPNEKFALVDPSYAFALYLKAYLDESRAGDNAAVKELSAVRQLAPYYMMPVIESGYLAQKRGDNDEAVKLYEQALDLVKQFAYNESYLGRIYRGLGETEIDRKNYAVARDWLDKALKLDPNDAGAKRELTYLEYVQKKNGGR